jgi:hydroxymethylpyrimidine/phosphomethylpyrimidine kinase
MATPVALTIAGSDSSGGAGIQADLKTFTALGVYGASVLTALTAQNTRGVSGILSVPPDFVAQQIAAVADDLDIGATKTGMLNDRATVLAVAAAVRRHGLKPLVVDPVMVATSGDLLLEQDAIAALREELIPLADLLTPNLAEAARLLGQGHAKDEAEMGAQAQALLRLGCKAVVVKGGHGAGAEAVDVLAEADGTVTRLALPRIDTPHTHGTGCTFSAAVTAFAGRGATGGEAVRPRNSARGQVAGRRARGRTGRSHVFSESTARPRGALSFGPLRGVAGMHLRGVKAHTPTCEHAVVLQKI